MVRYIYFLITILLICTGCDSSPEAPLQINGFHISSEAPEALARWYTDNLGFEQSTREEGSLVLKNHNASISIDTHQSDRQIEQTQKSTGFFKIGFKTSNLDNVYESLKGNGVSFKGVIFYDSNLKTRSLVALDSDGNHVQFFEDKSTSQLKPYFFSLIVLDFEQSLAWCENTFGFTQAYNLDLPEKGLSIRLMQKDDILLELINDTSIETTGTPLPGIQSVTFNNSRHGDSAGKLIYTPEAG